MSRRQRPDDDMPQDARAYEAHEHIADLPTRVAILAALEQLASPTALGELAVHLGVSDKPALNALKRRLLAMTRDGQLARTRGLRFGLASAMDLIPGRVLSHRDGYAFVRPDSGGEDIYLEPREARRTLHGDKVLVRIAGLDRRDRPYGNLVDVLERANAQIVGRYFRERGIGIGFVVADNRHIHQEVLIPAGQDGGASDGQIVIATIEQQPDQHTQPIGRIVEVLGEHMAPGMEIEVAIRSHNLPSAFPPAVLAAAEGIAAEVSAAECDGRRDLTNLPLVTIDGADARDFDDAVCARRKAGGYLLHVAIADVSHYVRPDSALDREAVVRGTSVYFPDRVIPMLPEHLSNGICSLNPHVLRLALVCELEINEHGEVQSSQFYEAVFRSRARLIYEDVERWHRGEREGERWPAEVEDSLHCLYDLYAAFRARRETRGALDIDTIEPRFRYDERGKIAGVEAVQRVDAHRLIEECMIAANVAAARYLETRKQPALYRVHDLPNDEKAEELGRFLRELGLRVEMGEKPNSKAFAAVLAAARDRPDKRLIEAVVLKSLKLAVYSASNSGHFGLALPAYAHFTSPIRRYPDLVVHRAIKAALAGVPVAEGAAERMAELGGQCSLCERRADDATRDAIAWLKCEYMQDKVGAEFSGIISGVAEFGCFIELDQVFVEGLLHVTELPGDYYHYDAIRHTLSGRSSGREFRLGQPVTIVVARVDLDQRKIDFKLAGAAPARRQRRRR